MDSHRTLERVGLEATDKYASEDDVLLRALPTLREYEMAMADIQEGMDDEAAFPPVQFFRLPARVSRKATFKKRWQVGQGEYFDAISDRVTVGRAADER